MVSLSARMGDGWRRLARFAARGAARGRCSGNGAARARGDWCSGSSRPAISTPSAWAMGAWNKIPSTNDIDPTVTNNALVIKVIRENCWDSGLMSLGSLATDVIASLELMSYVVAAVYATNSINHQNRLACAHELKPQS